MQSYLLGCSKIFFGFRNIHGTLQGTEMTAIEDLTTEYNPTDVPFDPDTAISQLERTLQWLLNTVSRYPGGRVWRLKVFPPSDRRENDLRPLSYEDLEATNAADSEDEPRIGLVTERLVDLMRGG